MTQCRICKDWRETGSDPLIHYSTRHAVHLECGMKHWKEKFFDRITPDQCNKLPAMTVVNAGFSDAITARIKSNEPTLRVKNTGLYKFKKAHKTTNAV